MEYVEAIVPIQHALVGKGLTPYKPLSVDSNEQ